MLTITKPNATRVDIHLDGAVDAETMAKGLDDLIAKSEGVENGRMLYRISSFDFPTLGAIGAEFARMPKLIGLLRKFDRCAVVTDIAWLRTAAEVEGAFLPGLTIQSFQLNEVAEAEAWLSIAPA